MLLFLWIHSQVKSMWSDCHQKHLVLVFWHKHVLSLLLLEVIHTLLPGSVPSNLDFIFACQTSQKGQKCNYTKMLRLWNKERIQRHGLRTNKGIHIGCRPPPLLTCYLGTKYYSPGWAMSCWDIAVLMQYRMQSFINQSIYGKGGRRDLTEQRLTDTDESRECHRFILVWLAKKIHSRDLFIDQFSSVFLACLHLQCQQLYFSIRC